MTDDNELIEFRAQVQLIKPIFESKEWCVVYNDYYIGLTGYKKQKYQWPLRQQREQYIISLNYCNMVTEIDKKKETIWEVKTYWTFRRNLFPCFEYAWRMFLEEENKYDPKKIKWSKLGEEGK